MAVRKGSPEYMNPPPPPPPPCILASFFSLSEEDKALAALWGQWKRPPSESDKDMLSVMDGCRALRHPASPSPSLSLLPLLSLSFPQTLAASPTLPRTRPQA